MALYGFDHVRVDTSVQSFFFDLIFRVLGEFVSEAEKVLSDELHVLLG